MKLESHLNYEGQNSEIVGTYILKELGYEIVHSSGLENRKMMMGINYEPIRGKKINPHYEGRGGTFFAGDIICRKGKQDYIFDVKLKIFKEGKNMNVFYVTSNEVSDWNKLTKSDKVQVMILINLKKDDGYYYGIFHWCDFKYPKNFNPRKSKKTTIRLEGGFDISKLTKFRNKRNYKFEKYLNISKIKTRKFYLGSIKGYSKDPKDEYISS